MNYAKLPMSTVKGPLIRQISTVADMTHWLLLMVYQENGLPMYMLSNDIINHKTFPHVFFHLYG